MAEYLVVLQPEGSRTYVSAVDQSFFNIMTVLHIMS